VLGIRRWQGVALDLYVGDPVLFFCDRGAKVAVPSDVDAILRGMEADGLRHVAIVPRTLAPWDEAKPLMQHVMATLDAMGRPLALGRVTFILGDRAQYDAYQRALFATFPDEP
jgi:hypothetical protein